MERLKAMKEQLTSLVQSELSHCETADTHELGEAVDMIKDLAETMYYCSITEAMEKGKFEENEKFKGIEGYRSRYYTPYLRNMDRDRGIMYYPNNSTYGDRGMSSNRNTFYYEERMPDMYREYPVEMRDYREGRSPIARKMYMETKEMHKDAATQMKELENYIQESGRTFSRLNFKLWTRNNKYYQ